MTAALPVRKPRPVWKGNRSGFVRSRTVAELDSPREGMIPGFSLGSYVKLVAYTGRLFREGKASISAELAEVFVRLG